MKHRLSRYPTGNPVTVHTDQGRHQAVLRNISTSGAKVEGAIPVPYGAHVVLDLLGAGQAATVVWRRGPFMGVKFDQTLTASELTALHRPGSVSLRDLVRKRAPGHGQTYREMR